MLAEAIVKLEELHKRAVNPHVFTVPGLHDTALMSIGGSVERVSLPPKRRAHVMRSFADLLDMASKAELARKPHIFHDEKSVEVILDADARNEVVTCPLRYTERFELLLAMSVKPFNGTPSEVVKLLRFKLEGIGCDPIVSALQKVDFNRNQATVTRQVHGTESLGRSVEAQVQGVDKIPETFDVQLAVYSNDGLRGFIAKVRCGLYLDAMNGRIEIAPLADEVQNAIEAVHHEIRSTAISRVPNGEVFNGKPVLV